MLAAVLTTALVACGPSDTAQDGFVDINRDPFPSSYTPLASETTLIVNATVLDGKGGMIEGGSVLMEGGKIKQVGTDITPPDGARVIDAAGRWVTPGIIDVHSHLGVYPSPGTQSHSDGNEVGDPVTAGVWAEHSLWPQDPGFGRAAAGGVTAMQLLPGSANLVGGALCYHQKRAGPCGAGYEISGCSLRYENGLRRKPQAGLWRREKQCACTAFNPYG